MKFVCPEPGRAIVFVLAVDKAVLSLLRSILKSFSPLSEFGLGICIFAKSNIAKRSGVSVLGFMLIRLNCRPCDRVPTQDPFDLISPPALMPKFYGPLMSRRQGSKKRLQPPVIAFQIRGQLNQYWAEFACLMKWFEPLQHGPQHGKPFGLEAMDMRDFSVGLGCIEEVRRSTCEPCPHGVLTREPIPHTIEFNGPILRGVVAKESG
jgi:hypothetical protein